MNVGTTRASGYLFFFLTMWVGGCNILDKRPDGSGPARDTGKQQGAGQ